MLPHPLTLWGRLKVVIVNLSLLQFRFVLLYFTKFPVSLHSWAKICWISIYSPCRPFKVWHILLEPGDADEWSSVRAGPPVHSWLSCGDGIAWNCFRRHICPLGSCPEPWAATLLDWSPEPRSWTRLRSRWRSTVTWGFLRVDLDWVITWFSSRFAQLTESFGDALNLTKLLIFLEENLVRNLLVQWCLTSCWEEWFWLFSFTNVLTKFLKLPQPYDLIKLLTELVGDGFHNFILGEVSELKWAWNDTFDDYIDGELTEVRRAGWLGFLTSDGLDGRN